jgi:hypothetical protein
VASITGGGASTGPFTGDYTFKLEWMRPNGRLSASAEYPLDSPENMDAIQIAVDKWEEYVILTDPKPGYKKPGEAKVTDGVFHGTQLDNTKDINTYGRIIIPRYWPRSYLDRPVPVTPTIETLRSNHPQRMADFRKAEAAILDMIDAIEASPLYEVENPETATFPLQDLAERMKAHISYPDADLRDRAEFDRNGTNAWIDPAKSGALFEYFFGFIPPNNDTGYVNGNGPFAF